MGAARGRGGARAASMPKHRGERGLHCSFLSGRKGEKGVGVVRCGVRSSEGGATTHGDGGGGQLSGEQGKRAGGGDPGTVARGPRLERVGQPGEKGNGLGPGKQCQAAVVN
jgi:hypothetical protein